MSQRHQANPQTRSPQHGEATRAAGPTVDAPTNLLRILLLEDDADTCEALELVLCPEDGFDLRSTGDVQSCLDNLRLAGDSGRPYDALLLDLALTGGRWGTEVIEAARRDPHMRLPAVVVCTALSGTYLEALLPILDACGARLVPKPFDVDYLVQTLRQSATCRQQP